MGKYLPFLIVAGIVAILYLVSRKRRAESVPLSTKSPMREALSGIVLGPTERRTGGSLT